MVTPLVNKRAVSRFVGQAEVSAILPSSLWPTDLPKWKPWMAVVGDCFVSRLTRDVFKPSPLDARDCPMVVCLPRGRIGQTMDVAEAALPATIEVLIVHLGADNLSSPSSDPSLVAAELSERLCRLRARLPRLRTVGICLLTTQRVDMQCRYDPSCIAECHVRSKQFNALVLSGAIRLSESVSVRYVDLSLAASDLRNSEFGPNDAGTARIGQVLQDIVRHERRRSPYSRIPRQLETPTYAYWPQMELPSSGDGSGCAFDFSTTWDWRKPTIWSPTSSCWLTSGSVIEARPSSTASQNSRHSTTSSGGNSANGQLA